MNITVLVKPVPYKSIVDNEGNVVRNKIKNIINKDDKYAIEEALKIKEKTNGKIYSISMTVKNNMQVLKDILSYGIDEAILLNDSIFAGSDTNATSYILSKAIRKISSDLIICGKASSDSATSQVGIGVATKLNIPFIYNVSKIIEINKKYIKCQVTNGNSYEIIESTIPCLIIVNDRINIPRIPTITNRLLAESKEIITWNAADIEADISKCGYNGSVTNVIKLTPIPNIKNTTIIKGTINSKIDRLINITKENIDNKKPKKFDIITNNNNPEYWIYADDFDISCKLIAKAYKLAKITLAKIVVITFANSNIEEYIKYGANKVINIDTKNNNYMTKALALEKIVKERKPEILLFNKTNEGKILSSYLSSKLNLGLSADCIKLEIDKDNKLIQIRSAYGGTMLASIVSKKCYTQMATVLPNEQVIYNEDNIGKIEYIKTDITNNDIKIVDSKNIKESYLNKDIVIACGMGAIKQLDNLQKLAKIMNASIGITRDVLDKGYLDSNYLIGQSGTIINSKIYLAFGISGALEHIIGVNSDIVISINNDPQAPILKISDYYINEDINEFIPLLINKLKEEENNE